MNPSDNTKSIGPPPVRHMLSQGRSLIEFAASSSMMPILMRAPRGDGHPVLLLPGFLAGDSSTLFLRRFLKFKNYTAEGWQLGRNLGRDLGKGKHLISDRLLDRLTTLAESYGGKVSLVGWSLGGVLAREMARIYPDKVRQVITLGSPFNAPGSSTAMVSKMFKWINGDVAAQHPGAARRLSRPPPVPSTAIYSRTDGITSWQACIEDTSASAQCQNIEVRGSHTGLGHNPQVMWIIAQCLAQAEGQWQPFREKLSDKLLFPNPYRVCRSATD